MRVVLPPRNAATLAFTILREAVSSVIRRRMVELTFTDDV